jgi:hypothetical protein
MLNEVKRCHLLKAIRIARGSNLIQIDLSCGQTFRQAFRDTIFGKINAKGREPMFLAAQ